MPRPILVLASLAALGCGGTLPFAPTYPAAEPVVVGRSDGRAVTGDAQPLTLYPGDAITVTAVSQETTSFEGLLVDESGTVHIPLVGDVQVGGLGLEEAEARAQEAFRRYDRFARVSVDVTEPGGHRALVFGAVVTPGAVPVGPGHRISDLLASAGGARVEVTEDGSRVPLADLQSATVYRGGEALAIDLSRALEGDPQHDVRARPGDRIEVPFAEGHVSVLGSVQGAGRFRFHPGMRFTEVLSLAGGPNEHADRDDIRLLRGGPHDPSAFRVSLDAISRGERDDPVLGLGDVVIVNDRDAVALVDAMLVIGPILAAVTSVTVTVLVVTTR